MSFENSGFESADELMVQDDGRAPLAMAAGLAAALVAGGLWAVLVIVTKLEIGYVAVGVGLLVGFAMSRVTAQRTQQLAYAAAVLALVGLAAGKAFSFAGSGGIIAKELEADTDAMTASVAWQMYEARELDDATLVAVDAVPNGAEVPPEVWASMQEQASAKLASLDSEQKHEIALATSRSFMQSMGMVEGIRAQLSLFDLLWVFLAVGTAFRMLAPPKEMEPQAEPAVTA